MKMTWVKSIGLFLMILATALFLTACKKEKEQEKEITTIPVAALLSITGNWSSLGITSQETMDIAVQDINDYLKSNDAPFRLSLTVFDTRLDTVLAKNFFTTARDLGYKFIIGPQSSAELASIMPLASYTDMLVVSQGSTAGTLSVEGDGIFRFCPPDRREGVAMANTIQSDGIKGLLTISRDDAGNRGLQSVVSTTAAGLGIQVSAGSPYSTSTTDFSGLLSNLRPQLETLISTHGAGNTAVYLASFDECVALFKQAAEDPLWSSVRWYGGDGVVLSTALISDTAAAAFAVATNFFAPTFGLPEAYRSQWEPLAVKVKTQTGIDPDAFGLSTYDSLWVLAKTLEVDGGLSSDYGVFLNHFIATANGYTGVTGPTTLDNFGDRNSGTFDYFGIVYEGNQYSWKLIGKSE